MDQLVSKTGIVIDVPAVRRVDARRPWAWLAAGWADLKAAPVLSVGVGLIYVALGYALIALVAGRPWLVMSYISGFLLVAPLLAIVFYAVSRRLERGATLSLRGLLRDFSGGALSIALYALVLGFMLLAWIQITLLATAFSMYTVENSFAGLLSQLYASTDGLVFLAGYLITGAVFAVTVYVASVVTIPLLLDRRLDPVTAVITSLRAVRRNPGPLTLWAGLIAALSLAGFATAMLGLAVTLPLIGHATWHAYRDLVGE